MNRIERLIDSIDPSVSVWLRALKSRWQHDLIARLIKELVSPGIVAIDVGANRGLYTFLLSMRVGRSGRVYSVEPYPGNAARLQTLARRHRNIAFYPIALSDEDGEAELRVPIHHGVRIDALATLRPALSTAYERFPVRLRTLDDLLLQETSRIAFLKCDVEGHEHKVLRGGYSTLRAHMPAIIVEIEQRDRAEPIDDTFEYLLDLGYVGYFLDSTGLQPLSKFSVERHQLAAIPSGFVP